MQKAQAAPFHRLCSDSEHPKGSPRTFLPPLGCPGQLFRRPAEHEPGAAAEAIGSLLPRDIVPTVGSFLCCQQDNGDLRATANPAPMKRFQPGGRPAFAMRGLSRARETDPRRRTACKKWFQAENRSFR